MLLPMLPLSTNIMALLNGRNFKFLPIGNFLVADLSEEPDLFGQLPVGTYGMESVLFGQRTESHIHDFPSFYLTESLDIECNGETSSLPRRAVTLVLPGLPHSWKPQNKQTGAVGSIDPRHDRQKIVPDEI